MNREGPPCGDDPAAGEIEDCRASAMPAPRALPCNGKRWALPPCTGSSPRFAVCCSSGTDPDTNLFDFDSFLGIGDPSKHVDSIPVPLGKQIVSRSFVS